MTIIINGGEGYCTFRGGTQLPVTSHDYAHLNRLDTLISKIFKLRVLLQHRQRKAAFSKFTTFENFRKSVNFSNFDYLN